MISLKVEDNNMLKTVYNSMLVVDYLRQSLQIFYLVGDLLNYVLNQATTRTQYRQTI
jgi:hypothetical protein